MVKKRKKRPVRLSRAALARKGRRIVPQLSAIKESVARRATMGAPGTFSTDSFIPESAKRQPPTHLKTTLQRTPPPLLLLPLRLEYRFVSTHGPLRGKMAAASATRKWNATTGKHEMRGNRRMPLKLLAPKLSNNEELWFRWLPDNGLAEEVTPPAEAFEVKAVNDFQSALGGRSWFSADDPAVLTAWQALMRTLSPERALHLLRTGGVARTDWQSRYGRMPALPEAIALYAVAADGTMTKLAQGASIDSGIRLDPRALDPKGWLVDYETALELGMGAKLQDPQLIALARDAEWIVAVGLRAGDAAAELSEWLIAAIANGGFGFIPQNTATNSSSATRAGVPDARLNLHEYLESQTADERGALGNSEGNSAAVFAEACGLDATSLRKAQFAADAPAADSAAMLRAIGPALLHQALAAVAELAGVDKLQLVEFFATGLIARGPLPVVRVGQNPYGVLPITLLKDLSLTPSDAAALGTLAEWLRKFALVYRAAIAPQASTVVPVLHPEDPDAANKLGLILRQYSVSRRLEVRWLGAPKSGVARGRKKPELQPLACPYVTSRNAALSDELTMLLTDPLKTLPDPDEKDSDRSLLYRLIRAGIALAFDGSGAPRRAGRKSAPNPLHEWSLAQLAKETLSIPGLNTVEIERARHAATTFVAALTRLRLIASSSDGQAQLETLLFETADLFQHRLDAWSTGLAYRRLRTLRNAGHTGITAGYYGMLGKLRPQNMTGSGDGYLQAPSVGQVVTAAALRSAYRRHRDNGAFVIDLSSRRLRRALAVLDLLKKGLGLAEVLGLHGERWLHDNQQDALIPLLRNTFPLLNPLTDDSVGLRLFDGLEFLAAATTKFASGSRETLQGLRAYLNEELDALSDLLLAEAAHQRALGQAEAANAWLAVLSGGTVPGDPAFPRTPRQSQGSTHRVMFAMRASTPGALAAPREIAEPSLAALAAETLDSFSAASGIVELVRTASGASAQLSVKLSADLGMTSLDLVLGGENEVTMRMTAYALRLWRTRPTLVAILGPLPPRNLGSFLSSEVELRFDLGGAADNLARASRLRISAQRGRPLDPAALNAAALPTNRLTADIETAILAQAITSLRARCSQLSARLTGDTGAYAAARGAVLMKATDLRQRIAANAPNVDQAALADFEAARTTFDSALDAVSHYSEPAALKTYLSEEIISDGSIFESETGLILDRLNKRVAALAAGLAASANMPAGRSVAREYVRALTDALQAALDGEGLPILPPIARGPETTPVLKDPPLTIANALGQWAKVRRGVAALTSAAGDWPAVRAHRVSEAATADEPPGSSDPRDPTIAPRILHFGVIIAKPNVPRNADFFAGWVSDEWSEQRPSREQTTGIAINYDSPQAEAPQCWLLGVPPADGSGDWTALQAAEIVWEALQWMKVRAVQTQALPLGAAALPGANRVAGKATSGRLPVGSHRQNVKSPRTLDGEFKLVHGRLSTGMAAADLSETRGFYKLKE